MALHLLSMRLHVTSYFQQQPCFPVDHTSAGFPQSHPNKMLWMWLCVPCAYLGASIGLMILVSHFSCRFTKLYINNLVSVLATPILLSYTKIHHKHKLISTPSTYLKNPTYNRWVLSRFLCEWWQYTCWPLAARTLHSWLLKLQSSKELCQGRLQPPGWKLRRRKMIARKE